MSAAAGRYKFYFIQKSNNDVSNLCLPSSILLSRNEMVNPGAHVKHLGSSLMPWGCLLGSIYPPPKSPPSWSSTMMTTGDNSWWDDCTPIWVTWSRPSLLRSSGEFSHFPGYTAWREFESRPVYFQSLTLITKTYPIIGWVSDTMRVVCSKSDGECSENNF